MAALCTLLIYALVGLPEVWPCSARRLPTLRLTRIQFVDVCYELAAFRVTIHVLTTLAVFGTVALGCPLEGALLLVLFATAHKVEEKLSLHAAGDLRALWASVPAQAQLVRLLAPPGQGPDFDSERACASDLVPLGALLLVRAGQPVPLDGVVVHGGALLSMEHLTGEAAPVAVGPGDEVPAGAHNADGLLVVRATRSAADSTPARIARLTAAAQARRPRVQRAIDTLSGRYSLAVLLASVAVALLAPVLLGIPAAGPGGSLYRAAAFLTAAAPCALLMAPLAYVAAIGTAAQRGALVRGGLTLEALAEVGGVALDKTGTLTTGLLALHSVIDPLAAAADGGAGPPSAPAHASHALPLAAAAALEQRTTHPVARAVLAAAAAAPGLPSLSADEFHAQHGAGVEALLSGSSGGGMRARLGSIDYVAQLCTPAEAAALRHAAFAGERRDVVSALILAPEPAAPGAADSGAAQRSLRLFFFSDSVTSRAAAAVARLRSGGALRLLMLTGDNAASAHAVAQRIGFPPDAVRAGLTPLDKLRCVEALRDELSASSWRGGRRVLMVGDGVNDAPALAAADIGAAIAATPSDAAAAAADILLLNGANSIALIPELLQLARRTRAVVRQNIAIAAVSVLAAALPAVAGLFPLWLAVLLHEGSTLAVALNSVQLLDLPSAEAALSAAAAVGGVLRRNALRAAAAAAAVLAAAAVAPLLAAAAAVAAAATGDGLARGALLVAQSAWAGLAAGALHTLTGPDHLAALTPLTIGRGRLQSTLLGGLWGMGHNTGQVIVGAVFLLLRERLNLELLETGSRVLVGLTLTLIGIGGAREALAEEQHAHSHSHSHSHSHAHAHGEGEGEASWLARLLAPAAHAHSHGPAAGVEGLAAPRRFALATYGTGVVHGLQPDSLLVLLPALALPTAAAAAYLLTFLGGTVLAMASYTAFIGAGTEALRRDAPALSRRVGLVSSGIALLIGGSLIFPNLFPWVTRAMALFAH